MSGLTVEGFLTRSVRDTATVLDAVHGGAPGDPYAAPPPVRPYVAELHAEPRSLRVGVLTEPVIELEVAPEVVAAARESAELLEALGHAVEPVEPTAIGHFEGAEDSFTSRYAAGAAAGIDRLTMVAGRRLEASDFEPMTWALAERGWRTSAAEYLAIVGEHQAISRSVADWFQAGADLLLTPTVGEAPPPLGSFDDTGPDPLAAFRRGYRSGAFSALFNITGQPAISLPLHRNDSGLPIGTQLVARFGREDLLIAVAAQLERARPWAEVTPPLFGGEELESDRAGASA
jgi:amidase